MQFIFLIFFLIINFRIIRSLIIHLKFIKFDSIFMLFLYLKKIKIYLSWSLYILQNKNLFIMVFIIKYIYMLPNNIFYMCIHLLLLINAYYKNVYLSWFFKYKNITKKIFFINNLHVRANKKYMPIY